MTKSLKGLSSRNFTTTTNLEEAFIGRETIAALSAASLSPADASLGDSGSIADDVIVLDDGAVPPSSSCSTASIPRKCVLQFLAQHGADSLDRRTALRRASNSATKARSASPVGGSVSGVIDFDGDTDDITVFLVAGQTYLISLRGTGADPAQRSAASSSSLPTASPWSRPTTTAAPAPIPS